VDEEFAEEAGGDELRVGREKGAREQTAGQERLGRG